jgi:hypothetical protein
MWSQADHGEGNTNESVQRWIDSIHSIDRDREVSSMKEQKRTSSNFIITWGQIRLDTPALKKVEQDFRLKIKMTTQNIKP